MELETSHNASQDESTVLQNIKISKYWNRHRGLKLPNKTEALLDISSQECTIKENSQQNKSFLDRLLIYEIDDLEEKERSEDGYTLVKILIKNVSEEKAITFRILNISQSKMAVSFIKKSMQMNQNLPNYVPIHEKQQIIFQALLRKHPEYQEVYQVLLSAGVSKDFLFEHLFEGLPEMRDFELLKHTLKYEHEKKILIEKLKFQNSVQSNNIDRKSVEVEVHKVKTEGKEWLEGYSSKKQLEGFNLSAQDLQRLQKQDTNAGLLKEEQLILDSIEPFVEEKDYLKQDYVDYVFTGSSMKKEKMEIQHQKLHSERKDRFSQHLCRKMRVPDVQYRLQQKAPARLQKNEIKFTDPSYDKEKEVLLDKKSAIICSLFYLLLKKGMSRERELTAIEEIILGLKREPQVSKPTARMLEKASQNYIMLKRHKQIY